MYFFFYPGSEDLISLSCLLPCCTTGFIIPVITEYTRNQVVLRQVHPDCVLPSHVWKLSSMQTTDWDAVSAGHSWSVGCCGDGLKLLTLQRWTSPAHLSEEKWQMIRALDSRYVLKMPPSRISIYSHYKKMFDCRFLLLLSGFLSIISKWPPWGGKYSSLPCTACKHRWCFTHQVLVVRQPLPTICFFLLW